MDKIHIIPVLLDLEPNLNVNVGATIDLLEMFYFFVHFVYTFNIFQSRAIP